MSELPEEIVEKVLVKLVRLLPLKDAVATTSILSRRWRYIRTCTTNLDFDGDQTIDCYDQENERCKFIKWMNRVINKLDNKAQLERFDLSGCHAASINNWIQFAMKKKVQILELNFLEGGGPRGISTCYGFFYKDGLESLKVLSLICVQVNQEVLESLLSKCPLLERLEVGFSDTLMNLRVVGRQPTLALKDLKLWFCENVKSIEICDATNLVSFYCHCFEPFGDPPLRLVLRNVPNLVDVDIHMSIYYRLPHAFFAALSCCVSQLQILRLYCKHSTIKKEDVPMLINLKELKLLLDGYDHLIFLHVLPFLERAPSLQRLVLQLDYWRIKDMEPAGAFWKPAKRPLDCLKEVEVTGYSGLPGFDELIFYFIDNAVSLEKIIVNPHKHVAWPYIESLRSRFTKRVRDHALGYIKEKIPKTTEFLCL